MQHNLRFIQLLLNLHDTVRLLRILVLDDVFFQGREIEGWGGVCEGGAGVAGEEFVDDFGEELVGNQGWVVGVADDDAGDAFSAAVGMKGVSYRLRCWA